MRREEQFSQFRRQGEGDHEVGRTDALFKLAFDPFGGGGFAALRAGPMIATVEMKLAFLACVAGMKVPAHFRSAAMGDGPDGSPLCLTHRASVFAQMGGQEASQRVDDGFSHAVFFGPDLAGQFAVELFDERTAVLLAAVGEVDVEHGGVDVAVPQQRLNGVQAGPGLDEMRGERMAQRVRRADGDVEIFTRDDHEPLQGAHGHRADGVVHAPGGLCRIAAAASGAGEEQQRMTVEFRGRRASRWRRPDGWFWVSIFSRF